MYKYWSLKNIKLTPEKAAIINDVAVIADLHLGFENVMQTKGVAIPRMQIKAIIKSVKKVIDNYGVNKLVIAGDLKHEFSKNLPYEWEDVRTFIESMDIEISVVRGNHDNFLAAILAEYGIELKEFEKVYDFYVVHGHKEVEFDKLIMGHEHPVIKLRVRGGLYSFPCYLVADRTKIVLPAFSPLMQGSDILQGEFLSPIIKSAKNIEVFAIEEEEVLYLGTIDAIKQATAEFTQLQ